MIPIKKEPKEMYDNTHVYEKCFFCRCSTDTWHEKTNNPVCSNCAKEHKVSELPNHFKKNNNMKKLIITSLVATSLISCSKSIELKKVDQTQTVYFRLNYESKTETVTANNIVTAKFK